MTHKRRANFVLLIAFSAKTKQFVYSVNKIWNLITKYQNVYVKMDFI